MCVYKCICIYMCIYIYIYIYLSELPRRDSKIKKRLQETSAIPRVLLSLMCMIALFSRSLFWGLESLLEKLWTVSVRSLCHLRCLPAYMLTCLHDRGPFRTGCSGNSDQLDTCHCARKLFSMEYADRCCSGALAIYIYIYTYRERERYIHT